MAQTVYTTCNPINIGCILYQEAGLDTPVSAGSYYDGTTCWEVNSIGEVIAQGSCTTTTTTTPPSSTYDCLNGECFESIGGAYPDLATCQQNCF